MRLLKEADIEALAAKPVIEDGQSFDFYNPSAEFQTAFTGVNFATAYAEAAAFLNHMFDKIEHDGGPIDFKGKRIVDFGSGWGRMLRLLRSKPELDNTILFGCEQHPQALRVCERTLPSVSFIRTGSFPPCDLREGCIDYLYAYSVFSHLNLAPHLAWAQEIARLLKPNGYACVTVQQRGFITLCKEYRDGTRPQLNNWHKRLAGAFLDDKDCFKRYDAGEFVFDYTTGGADMDSDVYGDAVAPQQFFEKQWGRLGFRLVDWWTHPTDLRAQCRAVVQKVG